MTVERTTPAIERAAAARARTPLHEPWTETVQVVLTAALNDPDDPDFLARTLYVLSRSAHGWITTAQAFGNAPKDVQVHWRAVADGLRMMLTGSGS